MNLKAFTTVHRRRNHSARAPDGRFLIRHQPTEIGLVRGLASLGVNLKNFKHTPDKDSCNHCLITHWEKEKS